MSPLRPHPALREALRKYNNPSAGEVHEMASALTQCRLYLTRFGSIDPAVLVQQIDDALEMYELREAEVNAALREKSA